MVPRTITAATINLMGLLRASFGILSPFFSLRPIGTGDPRTLPVWCKVFKKLDLGLDFDGKMVHQKLKFELFPKKRPADKSILTAWFVKSPLFFFILAELERVIVKLLSRR